MRISRLALPLMMIASVSISVCAEDALPLAIETASYPHIESIRNGTVKIPECRIDYTTSTYKSLVDRFDRGSAGDVIEVDIASYLKRYSAEEKHDWILIPVFPWREFPHRHVKAISPAIELDHPNQSIELWARGIVQSSVAVKMNSPGWDPIAAEKDYFKETRIFPIITVLAVRAELVTTNPWLPEALFIAYSQAKAKAIEEKKIPLPWGEAQREETVALMKENFWSYGIKNNPKTLSALFKYALEQGVISKELNTDDLFAPETLQLIDEKGAKN